MSKPVMTFRLGAEGRTVAYAGETVPLESEAGLDAYRLLYAAVSQLKTAKPSKARR